MAREIKFYEWQRFCARCGGGDRLDAIGWAAIFIWLGLVLLASNTDYHKQFIWWNGWGVFFAGVGIIVLIEALIRMVVPRYRYAINFGIVFGLILLAIGLQILFNLIWFWPLVFIIIGIVILVSAFQIR